MAHHTLVASTKTTTKATAFTQQSAATRANPEASSRMKRKSADSEALSKEASDKDTDYRSTAMVIYILATSTRGIFMDMAYSRKIIGSGDMKETLLMAYFKVKGLNLIWSKKPYTRVIS